jgi:hypothetical protein
MDRCTGAMTDNPMVIVISDGDGGDKAGISRSQSFMDRAVKTEAEADTAENKAKYDIYRLTKGSTETVFIGVNSNVEINRPGYVGTGTSVPQTVTVEERFLAKNSESTILRTVLLCNVYLRHRTKQEFAELQTSVGEGNNILERKHIFAIVRPVFTRLSNNVLWRTNSTCFDGQGALKALGEGDPNKFLSHKLAGKKIWETRFVDSPNHVFDVEFQDVVQESVNDQLEAPEGNRTLVQPLAIACAQGFLFVAVLVENWGVVVPFQSGLRVLLPTCLVLAFLITEQCVSCFAVGAGRNTNSFYIICCPYYLFSLPFTFFFGDEDSKPYTALRLWIETATAIMLLLSTIVVVNSQGRVIDILFNVGGLVLVSEIDDIFSNGKMGQHAIVKVPVISVQDIPNQEEESTLEDFDDKDKGELNQYLLFYRGLSIIIFMMLILPRYTHWVF